MGIYTGIIIMVPLTSLHFGSKFQGKIHRPSPILEECFGVSLANSRMHGHHGRLTRVTLLLGRKQLYSNKLPSLIQICSCSMASMGTWLPAARKGISEVQQKSC